MTLFVLPHIPNYCLTDRYMKITLWFYILPFPPHLHFLCVIKILPKKHYRTLLLFVDHSIPHPPFILVILSKSFIRGLSQTQYLDGQDNSLFFFFVLKFTQLAK